VFQNKNLTTNKLDKLIFEFIKEKEKDDYYEDMEKNILNFIIEKELIFNYNNKYLILSNIEIIIKNNKSQSLYKRVNKNEDRIFQLLKNNFPYLKLIREHSPVWLNRQRFDFYSEKHNLAIEWHGEQHYFPVEKYGGVITFELNQIRDEQKRILCDRNNIKLIELKYDIKDIEILEIIKKAIK